MEVEAWQGGERGRDESPVDVTWRGGAVEKGGYPRGGELGPAQLRGPQVSRVSVRSVQIPGPLANRTLGYLEI